MSSLGEHLGAGSAVGGGSGLGLGRSGSGAYRLAVVAIVAFIVQHCLLGALRIHGAQPDLMLLAVVVAALDGGPRRGAIMGFFVGLGVDLFVLTPFGLTALAFSLVGFAVGLISESIDALEGALLTVAVVAGASLAGTLLYVLLLVVVGSGSAYGLGWILLTVVLVNAVLALPMARMVGWATRPGSGGGLRSRSSPAGALRGRSGSAGGISGRSGAGAWR